MCGIFALFLFIFTPTVVPQLVPSSALMSHALEIPLAFTEQNRQKEAWLAIDSPVLCAPPVCSVLQVPEESFRGGVSNGMSAFSSFFPQRAKYHIWRKVGRV